MSDPMQITPSETLYAPLAEWVGEERMEEIKRQAAPPRKRSPLSFVLVLGGLGFALASFFRRK